MGDTERGFQGVRLGGGVNAESGWYIFEEPLSSKQWRGGVARHEIAEVGFIVLSGRR